MLDKREEIFLDKALKYKREYRKCAWWKFKKRRKLYKSWQSALDLMVMYGTK